MPPFRKSARIPCEQKSCVSNCVTLKRIKQITVSPKLTLGLRCILAARLGVDTDTALTRRSKVDFPCQLARALFFSLDNYLPRVPKVIANSGTNRPKTLPRQMPVRPRARTHHIDHQLPKPNGQRSLSPKSSNLSSFPLRLSLLDHLIIASWFDPRSASATACLSLTDAWSRKLRFHWSHRRQMVR